MKKILSLFVFGLVLLPLCGCSNAIRNILSEHKDFEFIQTVGGIEVGDLQALKDESYYLPVKVDVSGLNFVTKKPENLNSALAVSHIGYKIENNLILIWINTCVAGGGKGPISKGFIIDKLNKGKYSVQYLDKNGTKNIIRDVNAI
jgi:hypothetical protein